MYKQQVKAWMEDVEAGKHVGQWVLRTWSEGH